MVVTYMLVLIPAREHIETYLLSRLKPANDLSTEWARNIIRSLLVLSTALVAIQMPYFGSVLGMVGGLTDAYQSYIIPPLIALHMRPHLLSSSVPSPLLLRLIFLWGIGNVAFTCYRLGAAMAPHLLTWCK
jgi:amino acid permease